MSKIICDVCGTSFADSASQCPICGSVRQSSLDSNYSELEDSETAGYTYIKGGRFSKANVRKRVGNAHFEDVDEYGNAEENEPEKKKSDMPLVITAIILLLVIAAIVIFITLRFFGPNSKKEDDIQEVTTAAATQDPTEDDVIACQKLELLSETEINIPAGGTYTLNVLKEPADTTDELKFESVDSTIASVDEKTGLITPVGNGTTTIIISCGSQRTEIQVTCTVEEEIPFVLDNFELNLEYEGQEWILYSGEIPLDEIVFSSDDDEVATFADGVVCAVAPGSTTVRAKYKDIEVTCSVTCKFEEETGNGGNVSEDDGTASEDGGSQNTTEETLDRAPKATGTKGYKIKTNFGDTYVDSTNAADFDISHIIDGELKFRLVDAYGNTVNATWKVYNTSICSMKEDTSSTVVCHAEGTAYIVATTEDGETYVCTIRVS